MLIRPLVDPPCDLTCVQRLACAVIQQALVDMRADPRQNRSPNWAREWRLRRDTAAAWLQPNSEGLKIWAALAGVDPAIVLAHVNQAPSRRAYVA